MSIPGATFETSAELWPATLKPYPALPCRVIDTCQSTKSFILQCKDSDFINSTSKTYYFLNGASDINMSKTFPVNYKAIPKLQIIALDKHFHYY